MQKIGDIEIYGQQVGIFERATPGFSGGVTIELQDEIEPWATVTVNLPDAALEPGEFTVKTWSENESLRGPLLATGLFVDTGKRIPTGFVSAEVWRRAN
jgi:hypothetical protein